MIQVITERSQSPRLRYVMDFIFCQVLDGQFKFLSPQDTPDRLIPLIDYRSGKKANDAIQIWDCGQLDGWIDPDACIPTQENSHLTFVSDIFTEIFFHLSRMEEYQSLPKDEYGRHRAVDSYLWQKNKLASPVADEKIEQLRTVLNNRGAELNYRADFQFTATYDVDYPWLFLNRGWKQNLRGLAGDLLKARWPILKDRLSAWLGKQKDPYDLWEEISLVHRSSKVPAKFFLLFTDRKGVDPKVPYRSSAYQLLVNQLKAIGEMGWHPGYHSIDEPERWKREIKSYKDLLSESPSFSRHHYLRLEWPKTYRKLLAAGIEADYTLGYADQPGFRAGTCHPFYWYDLEKESVTPLKLYPLAFMEVTFNRYLGLSPSVSLEKMINIEKQVRKYKGHLIGLWHNNSFYPKEGWSSEWLEVYLNFIKRFEK